MKRIGLVLAVWAVVSGGAACASTIDFEQFASGTAITNQYAGVTFSGAFEMTSAGVASQVLYTPHSGGGFLANVTGPTITATFAALQSSVSGFYTAYTGMTAVAYGSNGDVLTTQTFAGNFGSNTAWTVGGPGIASISFTGPAGTVALDDLSYAKPTAVTPEPASLLLLGTGLCAASGLCVYRAAQVKRNGIADSFSAAAR